MDTDQTPGIQAAIVKALGLEELPEATRDELLAKMTEVVLKRVLVMIYEKLPEEVVPEFGRLQDAGEAAAVDAFLAEKIPGYDKLVEETVRGFVLEVKDTIETLKTSMSQ